MKKLFLIVFILAITTFPSICSASVKIILNGKEMNFTTPPTNYNGRMLVPLRDIFEALGANIEWNDSSRTVTAQKDSNQIILVVGGQATKNGKSVDLDVPARIINNKVMVPLRFISESFNIDVGWDNNTQTISLLTERVPDSKDNIAPTNNSNQENTLSQQKPSGKIYTLTNEDFRKIKNNSPPSKMDYDSFTFKDGEKEICIYFPKKSLPANPNPISPWSNPDTLRTIGINDHVTAILISSHLHLDPEVLLKAKQGSTWEEAIKKLRPDAMTEQDFIRMEEDLKTPNQQEVAEYREHLQELITKYPEVYQEIKVRYEKLKGEKDHPLLYESIFRWHVEDGLDLETMFDALASGGQKNLLNYVYIQTQRNK
ncbi:Copper amine oxidase N-terminal domain-containing protein [Desulfotomaculum arcticum]|uniref:Copper amine oxidase N-terminal domain-containing protein n=1 Tax=Desulfotruncus arcticus DSM 17038 TaxID=1121424 RepID=A0A1I2PJC2_9FIRM|nr:copper amine oxidase N-terminal domain-containing protein [Desulfotruncus arcticus]SFG15199.1 Copper amine oxidase N-terminal domain-containing protein [Desulfotomaculum arcticum] [Desulfotruncus arcticus DSM 17038]